MKKMFSSIIAAGALLLAGACFVAAQEAGEEKVPSITQVKIDTKSVSMPNSNPQNKWICAQVDFSAQSNTAFKPGVYLSNLKCTLTLGYKKTAASVEATKARGSKGKEAVEAAKKEQGGVLSADFTTYRATVTFAAVKVSGAKNSVQFFIPGEIVDRDKEAMSGKAKPAFAYVSFVYHDKKTNNDFEIGAFDKDGKLRPGFFEDNGVVEKAKIKTLADFDKLCNEIADPGVSETKGLLVPYYLTPGAQALPATPTIIRANEVEQ